MVACLIVMRVLGTPLQSSAGRWLVRWTKRRLGKRKKMHRAMVVVFYRCDGHSTLLQNDCLSLVKKCFYLKN